MSQGVHPVKQVIREIIVYRPQRGQAETYGIAYNCSRIEPTAKGGEHCDIPYIRVWDGEKCLAEFCQHSLAGVYFSDELLVEPAPTIPF